MYILLIIMFSGDMSTTTYQSHESCETALLSATDFGNYKKIKVASCIPEVDKEKN